MINNQVVISNVYTEVLTIINMLNKEDYSKIPEEYINYFEKNSNKEYEFNYDISKSLKEQNLLDETRYILFGLFEKFGATEKQKEIINSYRKNYYSNLEKIKEEKYNDLKNNNKNILNEESNLENKIENKIENNTSNFNNENTNLTIYKENIFIKIKNKILSFFHLN